MKSQLTDGFVKSSPAKAGQGVPSREGVGNRGLGAEKDQKQKLFCTLHPTPYPLSSAATTKLRAIPRNAGQMDFFRCHQISQAPELESSANPRTPNRRSGCRLGVLPLTACPERFQRLIARLEPEPRMTGFIPPLMLEDI